MRLKNEEIATLVILALSAVVAAALYLLAGASTPYSYDAPEGSRVTVAGEVLSRETTYQGGHVILLVRTGAGPLSVFVPADSAAYAAASGLEPGSGVEAIGVVRTYRGEKEVVAEKITET